MAQTLLASVTSSKKPQQGQDNRSSGNFSTDNMPSGTKSLTFKIKETSNPDDIYFNVMQDISLSPDPVIYKNAYNGFKSPDSKKARSLYIANPKGATADFLVEVYANHD